MNRDKGMALLMVMLLLALMAALAVGINQFWQSAFDRTLAQQTRLQAKWHLLGAESIARQWLTQSLLNQPVVHLEQSWAKPDQALRIEDGEIGISFRDAQACFNINTLNYRSRTTEEPPAPPSSPDAPVGEKPPAVQTPITRRVFDALVANLGISEAEIKRLGDTMEARLTQGNMAFSDISELRAFAGISQEHFLRLKALLCVLPEREPYININTLEENHLALLQALFLNQATPDALKQLLAARPSTGWQSVSAPDLQQTLLKLHLPPLEGKELLTVSSHYFSTQLTMENEMGSYQLHNLLRYEQSTIRVLDRQIKYRGDKQ